jgi:uncharacterized damage-inducible protein DinB
MTETDLMTATVYAGWQTYQSQLVKALAPLSPEQLGLSAAPGVRAVSDIARHIIGARARWFHQLFGEGGDDFAALGEWDRKGAPARTSAELIQGLEATWKGMHEAIGRWTPADWQQTYPGDYPSDPATITRQWVIWHLIEHDLHHGGEISLTLGMHGLAAPDL